MFFFAGNAPVKSPAKPVPFGQIPESDAFVKITRSVRLNYQQSPTQDFYSLHLSLSRQIRQGHLSSAPVWPSPFNVQPEQAVVFREGFEGSFPAGWQSFATNAASGWKKRSNDALSGSFSIAGKSVASEGTKKDIVSWLVRGPFQVQSIRKAVLTFYQNVRLNSGSLFFWGVSTNGTDFYGYGTSGNSEGWQFVDLNVGRIPGLKHVNRASSVWIGFCVVGSTNSHDNVVHLDDMQFSVNQVWQQEFTATVNGQLSANFYGGGLGLARPAYTDIDGDGDADLFVGTYDGNILFYRNDGSATTPEWKLIDANYADIDVGENSAPAFYDIDFDNDADLFVGDAEGFVHFYRNEGTVYSPVWKNRGRLKNTDGQYLSVQSTATPALANLNGDDVPEMLIGNAEGFFAYYKRESANVWRLVSNMYAHVDVGSFSSPAFADIDADGDLDLFTGIREKKIFFYENDGNSKKEHFQLSSKDFQSLEAGDITSPAFADLNDDGVLDLTVGDAKGEVIFFRNAGTKSAYEFLPSGENLPVQSLDVGYQCVPSFVDLDNDKDLDLVVGENSGKLTCWENVGTPQKPAWQELQSMFDNVVVKQWSAPVFADIDADGDQDLICGAKFGRLELFENKGAKNSPEWVKKTDAFKAFNFQQQAIPALADIDADGDMDLFVGTSSEGIKFIKNTGSKRRPEWVLEDENYLNSKRFLRPVPRFLDIDHDGDLDLIVGTKDGNLVFIRNDGTVRKPKWHIVTEKFLNIDVRFFSVPAFADIDADGDADLFLGNNSGGLLFWRNLSNEPNMVTNLQDRIIKKNLYSVVQFNPPHFVLSGDSLSYRLMSDRDVVVTLLDVTGGKIVTLVDGYQSKGDRSIAWPGVAADGSALHEGVYGIVFQTGTGSEFYKIVFFRSPPF